MEKKKCSSKKISMKNRRDLAVVQILPKTKKGGSAQLLHARKLITFAAFHRKIPRGKSANVMERNTIVQALSCSP